MTATAANISSLRPTVDGAPRSLEPGQAGTPDLDRTRPERVLAALAAAWGYYTCPPLHARASAYLAGRGIDVAVLETHTGRPETGHTPARADGLVAALQARGFSEHELVDAGLAHRRLGRPVSDFYRQRVLIPIRDEHQRVVGLIGRNVGDQQRWAKYKNPPRTAVYDKSINLYQPLPSPADTDGHVIVVEGTLDAMAIAVAAIRSCCAERLCPVTQSGRQLSAHQIRYVRHLDPHPILAFDADDAGDQSTSRVGALFALAGADPGVVHLPPGEDPASWLAHDGIHRLAVLAPGANPDRRPAGPRPSAHTLAPPAATQVEL